MPEWLCATAIADPAWRAVGRWQCHCQAPDRRRCVRPAGSQDLPGRAVAGGAAGPPRGRQSRADVIRAVTCGHRRAPRRLGPCRPLAAPSSVADRDPSSRARRVWHVAWERFHKRVRNYRTPSYVAPHRPRGWGSLNASHPQNSVCMRCRLNPYFGHRLCQCDVFGASSRRRCTKTNQSRPMVSAMPP